MKLLDANIRENQQDSVTHHYSRNTGNTSEYKQMWLYQVNMLLHSKGNCQQNEEAHKELEKMFAN